MIGIEIDFRCSVPFRVIFQSRQERFASPTGTFAALLHCMNFVPCCCAFSDGNHLLSWCRYVITDRSEGSKLRDAITKFVESDVKKS